MSPNIFKLALCKVGAGVKFVAVGVWHEVKSVFGSDAAKKIGLAAFKSAEELMKTEVGQFIKSTVESLEQVVDQPGAAKLATATSQISEYLSQRGTAMPNIWIHWAVQSILLGLRGGVAALTDKHEDSDGDGVPDTLDVHPLDATQH